MKFTKRKLLLKEEAVINTSHFSSIIGAFNKALQARVSEPMYGNVSVYDVIQKDSGNVVGVKYNIGDGTKAIRYCFKGNKMSSVDLWLKTADDPQYTVDVEKYPNLIQVVEPIAGFLGTGNPKQYIAEGKISLREDHAIADDADPFQIFTWNLRKKSKDNPWVPIIIKWSESLDKDNPDIISKFASKKILPICRLFEHWAADNKIPLPKGSVYGKFSEVVTGPLDSSGFFKLKPLPFVPAGKESKFINAEEEAQFNKIKDDFKLSPDEIFDQIETYVKACIEGTDYSLIVAGDPGIGKTTTVNRVLKAAGMSPVDETELMEDLENDEDDDESFIEKASKQAHHTIDPHQYIFISGKMSVYGLYTLLYDYNGALVVFDDCDSMFDSEDGINLIKGATDDKAVRRIGMRNKSTMKDDSPVPPAFDYKGRIIFITNRYMKDIDTAIVSRALVVEVNLSAEESLQRIKQIMPNLLKETPQATMAVKKEVLEFLLSINKIYTKLDFRTFEQAVKERLRGSPNWQKLVVNSMIAKRGIFRK